MNELKPCPFCGGEAYIEDGELCINHRYECFFEMYPLNYDDFGRMGIEEINRIFINAWNRRVENEQ